VKIGTFFFPKQRVLDFGSEQQLAMEVKQPRLPPGFRFCPTDVELIVHYLRRRALATPLPAAVDIPDVRILAHDPSELLPPGEFVEPSRIAVVGISRGNFGADYPLV
jgi:hypothetical protein